MLTFTKVKLNDIDIFRKYFVANPSRISMRSVGAFFLWREFGPLFYAEEDDVLYIYSEKNNVANFFIPLSIKEINYPKAFKKIEDYCLNNGFSLRFHNLDINEIDIILEHFNDCEVGYNEKWADYVYNVKDLSYFEGKKYHGQRNFVNRFKKNYPNYSTIPITQGNLEKVKEFIDYYYSITSKESSLFNYEKEKLSELLNNYELYSMSGLVLMVGDKIVACSIGEKLGDTLFIHVEKADKNYKGSYQMIVSEYLKYYADEDIKYTNREDDAGDEGLKLSKKSYHPVFMQNKYHVSIKL